MGAILLIAMQLEGIRKSAPISRLACRPKGTEIMRQGLDVHSLLGSNCAPSWKCWLAGWSRGKWPVLFLIVKQFFALYVRLLGPMHL